MKIATGLNPTRLPKAVAEKATGLVGFKPAAGVASGIINHLKPQIMTNKLTNSSNPKTSYAELRNWLELLKHLEQSDLAFASLLEGSGSNDMQFLYDELQRRQEFLKHLNTDYLNLHPK